MQARFCRAPQTYRVVRAIPSQQTRNMSLFGHSHPFFRGFPSSQSFNSEIAPLFRLLDDYATSATRAIDSFSAQAPVRAFQPRFDIREVGDAYELRGELPGVDSKDIEVEFTDAQTLVIRGRTERESSSGNNNTKSSTDLTTVATAPVANEIETTQTVKDDDAMSTHSDSSYHKATVEDAETGEIESTSSGSVDLNIPATTTANAGADTINAVANTTTPITSDAVTPVSKADQGQYWVTERRVGTFQRVFQFPARVDHESVKASLKNGILSMFVPKTKNEGVRRIVIE